MLTRLLAATLSLLPLACSQDPIGPDPTSSTTSGTTTSSMGEPSPFARKVLHAPASGQVDIAPGDVQILVLPSGPVSGLTVSFLDPATGGASDFDGATTEIVRELGQGMITLEDEHGTGFPPCVDACYVATFWDAASGRWALLRR